MAGIAVGAVAAVAGGFAWANHGWVSTDDAFIEGHVVAISPRVPGHVLKVMVEDNQLVEKDQPLAEIDPADYLTDRDAARAQVDAADAAAHKTELDVRRYEALTAKNEASRQTLDHARADARSAAAAREAAQARLRQAELNLSYTRIKAPQAGQVTRKTVEEGAYVGVGQSLLAIVPKEIWVVANFKETQLRRMRPGDRAEISVDAYSGKMAGRVDSLQSGTGERFSVLPAENATGNFVKVVQRIPVKIALDSDADAGRPLAPGMSVEAEVEVR
ncbi:MAG TPA: HlyD family secretion protein [Elusimicrobiota bacterium]|nr:HlyD family secretion protein [Elusimicrobiota bacterium]